MTGDAIFTVGHSSRSFEEFSALLDEHGIERIVDVRRLPGSNRHPQFNQDALAAALADGGIRYSWAEDLTGRRNVSTSVPFATNAWWQNRSFHNYADHAYSSPEFGTALAHLAGLGETERVAVMCSEAVWWRCHRRIIADYLLAARRRVTHILGPSQSSNASLSTGAVLSDDDRITYPEPSPIPQDGESPG